MWKLFLTQMMQLTIKKFNKYVDQTEDNLEPGTFAYWDIINYHDNVQAHELTHYKNYYSELNRTMVQICDGFVDHVSRDIRIHNPTQLRPPADLYNNEYFDEQIQNTFKLQTLVSTTKDNNFQHILAARAARAAAARAAAAGMDDSGEILRVKADMLVSAAPLPQPTVAGFKSSIESPLFDPEIQVAAK